jgi:hypothetical protein
MARGGSTAAQSAFAILIGITNTNCDGHHSTVFKSSIKKFAAPAHGFVERSGCCLARQNNTIAVEAARCGKAIPAVLPIVRQRNWDEKLHAGFVHFACVSVGNANWRIR